jgi:hypothetical protein
MMEGWLMECKAYQEGGYDPGGEYQKIMIKKNEYLVLPDVILYGQKGSNYN